MTDKLKKSIEQYKVPISIAKIVGLILFVFSVTWVVATEYDKLSTQAYKNAQHYEKLEIELDAVKVSHSENQIKLAEIQKDVQWIRITLERGIDK